MVVTPIKYMGKKDRLIKKGLTEHFPKNISTFIDAFAGSGAVTANTQAEKYIMNDLNKSLIDLHTTLFTVKAEEIIEKMQGYMKRFDMPSYGTCDTKDPDYQKNNAKYKEMRAYYNSQDPKDPMLLFVLMHYAFSTTMRFNKQGGFNMPFGSRGFSTNQEKVFKNYGNYVETLVEKPELRCLDVFDLLDENFIKSLDKNAFIYLDPPYTNTDAAYTRALTEKDKVWTEEVDLKLFEVLNQCNTFGVNFALSNVLTHNKKTNSHLIDWIKETNLNVIEFKGVSYSANGQKASKSQEVLITNYK